ncbi:5-hydroxytryptamine receptor-like [Synchiropus splendidus]|uniref:5-hydroxytryptamine receptor-like n=1 Tax=Synchiropus splendidus TaxID=270530 RepID=UPI00237E826D|nr:5-hydroxytryptamine receptor-like [Synchiropus splendidus]
MESAHILHIEMTVLEKQQNMQDISTIHHGWVRRFTARSWVVAEAWPMMCQPNSSSSSENSGPGTQREHGSPLSLEMKSDLSATFGNHSIWDQYIDVGFVTANSLILGITSVVGVAANLFVILAVYYQKSLRTWNNALVVNLATIDILRCLVDCPVLFTIVLFVHQQRRLDQLICDAQIVSFSFSCCVQLLTLACISAERYQAIAQPFKTVQRRRRIIVLIPLTWILAVLLALSSVMFLKDSPVHVYCRSPQGEASSYDTFGLYTLFPLWAACFAVIIGFYTRIFTHVRAHNRKIFDQGTVPVSEKISVPQEEKNQMPLELVELETKDGSKKDSVALQEPELVQNCATEKRNQMETKSPEGSGENPVKSEQSDSATEGKPSTVEASVASSKPQAVKIHSDLVKTCPLSLINGGEALAVAALDPGLTQTEATTTEAQVLGAVCMMPAKSSRERATKRKESNLAKRAGYIILTFLLFWLPLITTILLNFAVHENKYTVMTLDLNVEILSVSIACITSLSDPIIYAALNPQFRTEFHRLKRRVRSLFTKES